MLKKIMLYLLAILFFLAGINHFRNPLPYQEIMPTYFPYKDALNLAAGLLEILFSILLVFKRTRFAGAMGILVLLVAFIPVHIFMIQKNGCTGVNFCFPAWVAWVRLFPLQFVLIWWAWWVRTVS